VLVLAVVAFGWTPTRREWGVLVLSNGVLIAFWSSWRFRHPNWCRHDFWTAHVRLLGVVGLPRLPLGRNRHERVDGSLGLVMAVVFALIGVGLVLHLLTGSS
jgi:hypothetical protein